jgi:hypothetical protein
MLIAVTAEVTLVVKAVPTPTAIKTAPAVRTTKSTVTAPDSLFKKFFICVPSKVSKLRKLILFLQDIFPCFRDLISRVNAATVWPPYKKVRKP